MECSICAHPKRAEIEKAILRISSTNPSITIEGIAEEYGVTPEDIKKHAILHQALPTDLIPVEEPKEGVVVRDTLARRAKIQEAQLLEDIAFEYYTTLKNLGVKINGMITDEEDIKFTKLLTKPVADMYISLGTEIRQTVSAMAELDRMLNGPKDDNASGLTALAMAIAGSKQ